MSDVALRLWVTFLTLFRRENQVFLKLFKQVTKNRRASLYLLPSLNNFQYDEYKLPLV